MTDKETLDLLEKAAEYIEKLSEKTITPITGWNIRSGNKVTVFYKNPNLKKKADDHGTTELLREMFFKYLTDNCSDNISAELTFDSNTVE